MYQGKVRSLPEHVSDTFDKKTTLSEYIAPCLVQTNKPKDNHAMQIVAEIVIVSSRFGSSISFFLYAFYLDIHVQ